MPVLEACEKNKQSQDSPGYELAFAIIQVIFFPYSFSEKHL